MVPWMSDARLVFLVWFVGIAVAIAVGLVYIEIRLKNKKKRVAASRRDKTPINRMKIVLVKRGDVKRKFEVVSKTAKDYFREEYGMSKEADYSELAKDFEQRGKGLEAEFCRKMFELYYSNKELTEEGVQGLGEMLVEMGRKKKFSKDISKVPGVWEKMDRAFERSWIVVIGKIGKYIVSLREKLDRKARAASREEHELSSWVKKAIRMGNSRSKVSELLKDGKRSSGDVRKILRIYDEEFEKASREKDGTQFYGVEGGVAHRIIQKEKDRLEETEALSA